MSFIAKFYLAKMFRKQDALSVDGDYLKLTINNVISPIKNKDVPDEIWQFFELVGDDNMVLLSADDQDAWAKIRGEWNGTSYTLDNYKDLQDTTIAVGDVLTLWVPNPGWSAGETHKLTFRIKQDRPIEFSVQLPVV
ncbi:MAG TPA: hypothetical protein VKK79_15155 [Candidatus Lokiarchaeia archaeon]|nr:hypothetical protein [Candidatus Lokiarchaeia archaeon]